MTTTTKGGATDDDDDVFTTTTTKHGLPIIGDETQMEIEINNAKLRRTSASLPVAVAEWQVKDVLQWATVERYSKQVLICLQKEEIDGQVLLALTEDDVRDFRYRLNYPLTFSDLKKLWLSVRALQHSQGAQILYTTAQHRSPETSSPHHNTTSASCSTATPQAQPGATSAGCACGYGCSPICSAFLAEHGGAECYFNSSPPGSVDGRPTNIPPEFFKTAISIGYSFLVTGITSFVMVIVHERVPDMKRYPPLPDIFLDNVPHIPWAFSMCEITGTLLFFIWTCVCIFHKHRMVLLRRFFAIAGTVFLLRCVTMLITSLSVPGTHLQCNQSDYAIDDTECTASEALEKRIHRAYTIWSGLGMSIQGVRTCGDYMFSGHTVALTLLNFFITEYTPRNLYFLHTLTWLLNMFGIFFILAAHEHYSIDVFVAFYITSRLFLYYHTLANNQTLMSRDSTRTRIWFPMFSYFESSVNGIVPNEYDTVYDILCDLMSLVVTVKDAFMLTAHRYWVEAPMSSRTSLFSSGVFGTTSRHCNAATSTHPSDCSSPSMQVCTTSTGRTTTTAAAEEKEYNQVQKEEESETPWQPEQQKTTTPSAVTVGGVNNKKNI